MITCKHCKKEIRKVTEEDVQRYSILNQLVGDWIHSESFKFKCFQSYDAEPAGEIKSPKPTICAWCRKEITDFVGAVVGYYTPIGRDYTTPSSRVCFCNQGCLKTFEEHYS